MDKEIISILKKIQKDLHTIATSMQDENNSQKLALNREYLSSIGRELSKEIQKNL